MQRRAFLALTGVGAVAAGATAADLVPRAAGGGESPGELADPSIEQPLVPFRGSHRVLWSVETDEPVAALTFDDGPDPDFTPRILDVLAAHGVRATFMMMGYNASQHPELARAVVEAGHEVGNHTWTHLNLLRETAQNQYEELYRAQQTIEEVTGQRPRFFRPPRGQLTGPSLRHAATLGCDTVLWSVERGAPGESTPDVVADYLRTNLEPGDIVDLHDGIGRGTFDPDAKYAQHSRSRREVELAALDRIVGEATDRGLRLGTVSDLVAAERPPDRAPEQGPEQGGT